MDANEKSEQLRLIEDSARRFLEKSYSFNHRSALVGAEPGYSSEQWQQMTELGWMLLPLSEQYDGFGGDANLMCALMHQFGRSNFVSPYFSSVVVAARILQNAATGSVHSNLLNQIAEGTSIVSPALYEAQSRYDLHNTTTTAVATDSGYVLNGTKVGVQYGNAASHFLVLARTAGEQTDRTGLSLFLVPADCSGIRLEHYCAHDGARVSTLHLDNVEIESDGLVGAEYQALAPLQGAINYAVSMLCAEMTGVMDAMLEQTLEYVKTRTQFGSTIGSFQAIQHRLVDMYLRCELATSMSAEAARAVNELEGVDQERLVSAAKAEIGRAAVLNAEEAVHLHGAMGLMNEMPIGHYLKRCFSLNLLYGDADYHQARYRELCSS